MLTWYEHTAWRLDDTFTSNSESVFIIQWLIIWVGTRLTEVMGISWKLEGIRISGSFFLSPSCCKTAVFPNLPSHLPILKYSIIKRVLMGCPFGNIQINSPPAWQRFRREQWSGLTSNAANGSGSYTKCPMAISLVGLYPQWCARPIEVRQIFKKSG